MNAQKHACMDFLCGDKGSSFEAKSSSKQYKLISYGTALIVHIETCSSFVRVCVCGGGGEEIHHCTLTIRKWTTTE